MSRKRVSNSKRRPRRRIKTAARKNQRGPAKLEWLAPDSPWPARALRQGLKVHHFAGLSLSGGKTDKTCLAVVEYYPGQNKIFLSRLFEKIKSEGEVSSDLQLHQLLSEGPGNLELLAVDVPLKLPKCLRCRLKCPGYEICTEPEIEWMWQQYRALNEKRKPKRLFTPYTERCAEVYLSQNLEEVFHLPHALGANLAPLTARGHFVLRRLNLPTVEYFPRLSVWRIGKSLQLAKSHLLFHKHAINGEESRRLFLHKLIEKDLAFLYDQDVRALVENNQAFEAFVGALTAVLHFRDRCDPRPRGFPRSESWLAIPSLNLSWT